MPHPPTKIHQIRYTEVAREEGQNSELLAVSTEDGRVLFYSSAVITEPETQDSNVQSHVPTLLAMGELGGARDSHTARVKDFEILSLPTTANSAARSVVVSGSSDGVIRIWMLLPDVLLRNSNQMSESPSMNGTKSLHSLKIEAKKQGSTSASGAASVGRLLGTYDTGNRITCLKAFVMSEVVNSNQHE